MGYYSLKANFFVSRSGVAIPKAPPLKRSVAWKVWIASDKRCSICGTAVDWFSPNNTSPISRLPDKAHIDHILPRSRGGQNDLSNLRVTCMSCNCSRKADP